MKKIITNWRYYILAVLLTVGVLAVLSTPADEAPFTTFIVAFVVSKAIGIDCLALLAHLIYNWEAKGKIPELSELVGED